MSKKYLVLSVVLILVFLVGFNSAHAEANSSCVALTSDLSLGSNDSSANGPVSQLQTFLMTRGILSMPSGVPFGYFGSLTRAASAAFQASVGITPPVGYIGPKTRAKIATLTCSNVATNNAGDNSSINNGSSVTTTTTSVTYSPTITSTTQTTGNSSNAFQILVDVNQLHPDEALLASRFAADGVWAITQNSPAGINWPQTLQALNASKWAVSEDNPMAGHTTLEWTQEADFVSQSIGREVDGTMFYNEFTPSNLISAPVITQYAAHPVPGFGTIGNRIILLTRSYAENAAHQADINSSLANPNVSGMVFEFNPDNIAIHPEWGIAAGCKYAISVNKKCYLLMPPNVNKQDYLGDVQSAVNLFAPTGILNSPNVYVVIATYVRPNNQHYLSTSSTDRNSVEAIVNWLKAYRNTLGGSQIQAPVITSITPVSAALGVQITIRGSGFTSSGNIIKLGSSYNEGPVSSSDGNTLIFTFPHSQSFSSSDVQQGTYQLSIVNSNGESNAVSFTITGLNNSNQSPTIANVSSRGQTLSGDNVTISGFTITGTGSKQVLIMGKGPSLSAYGLSGLLADPSISLNGSSGLITSNNNWKDSNQAQIQATGLAPSNDLESGILVTLNPGAYSVILKSNTGGTGIGLVEVYDISGTAQLSNVSTRGMVSAGDNVLISGMIVKSSSGASQSFLFRGTGPSLANYGLSGVLQDPTISLYDSSGTLIGFDNDWQDSQSADIQASGMAPGNSKESAILQSLAPGAYTVILRGLNNTTGLGLMEIYKK